MKEPVLTDYYNPQTIMEPSQHPNINHPLKCLEWYRGKKICVTGAGGFKGYVLSEWLETLGAEVLKIDIIRHVMSNKPISAADLTQEVPETVAQSDVVFHLAAQAIVSVGFADPTWTFRSNIMGTVNLLTRCASWKVPVVVVTSDKVYQTRLKALTETDPLGSIKDPYSASKAAQDIIARSYASLGCRVAVARAGNVIGGGDTGKDRLVPDYFRAVKSGKPIMIRHPMAERPWQYVFDCLRGYLYLGIELVEKRVGPGMAFNFGPEDSYPVRSLLDTLDHYVDPDPKPIRIIQPSDMPETQILKLDSYAARLSLGWKPETCLEAACAMTARWWKRRSADAATAFSIEEYKRLCAS